MIEAWRLVKARQAAGAFTGEGARRYGGRWNFPGTSCVYLADSLPLAAMELFLHLGQEGCKISFVSFRVLIPAAVVQDLDLDQLPRDWRASPPDDHTKALGTQWANARQSAALKVPSAIMPLGRCFNYLINPAHADYRRVKVEAAQDFTFDPRMWK
ncbi:MAG: RES family NAD+ phosphorylase [Desulfarculus sp.]|nr:RES family NAD+ phosphorylase [Desulfarculus sp.]